MLKSLASLIRRIMGRVIKMFSNVLLQYGAVIAPTGFVLAFFAFDAFSGWKLYIALLLSLILVIFGAYSLMKAMDVAKIEARQNAKQFEYLINEIKGLRKDLTSKGGQDNDNPKSESERFNSNL